MTTLPGFSLEQSAIASLAYGLGRTQQAKCSGIASQGAAFTCKKQ